MRPVTGDGEDLVQARAAGRWPQHSCVGCPFAPRKPLASFKVMIAGFVLAIALSMGYSTYSLYHHDHQACAELRILATTGGAVTSYDQAIHGAYSRLYALRCG